MTKFRHGGNLRFFSDISEIPQKDILDFSANINPFGPPQWLRSVVSRSLDFTGNYPDPDCHSLVDAICAKWDISEEEVVVGNGSSEILYLLPRVMEADRALIPVPAYVDYARAARSAGMDITYFLTREEDDFALDISELEGRLTGAEIVFIARPNNPTGLSCCADSLMELAERHQDTLFIIDEAFIGFTEGMESLVKDRPGNFVILLSLTKIFGIPGLRLGFAVADPKVIRNIKAIKPPWSVNMIAQTVGEKALQDEEYLNRSVKYVAKERERLIKEIKSIGCLKVIEGLANFLLVRSDRPDMDAWKIFRDLLKRGIAIRVCDNFEGLDKRYFRLAVRTEAENQRLLESLRIILTQSVFPIKKKKTPAVMFQATGSNAGKSILTAAMCRILLQDGFRVAPFKAQNMSLNSFVTLGGGEMGRAQVVQAQACRLEPDVRMNPVLLKPNTDTGSQVIVNGKPVGNMNVGEYIRYKPTAFEAVKKAYDSLSAEFDAVVIEGAGSPAEVNLKHHDIVNMNMAKYAASPVLLIGDIDRGGVFASFIGTMEVLSEWERKMVSGFVINKFRGDTRLLCDALTYTRQHTGRDVLGVVPYIKRLGLPEEDSVGFKSGLYDAGPPEGEYVEIAVVDLPHISNFTDIDPFMEEPDVYLKIVRAASELEEPDAIIIPGSKNVMGDVDFLQRDGLWERIRELAAGGTEVVGLCAGFQILGERIDDLHGLESVSCGSIQGLGLLQMTNVLEKEKTLKRAKAEHVTSGLWVSGYEIHHGRFSGNGENHPALIGSDGEIIGLSAHNGRVWGTYLHGIFDNDAFRRWFIDSLRTQRGLAPVSRVLATYDLEAEQDRLAEIVRKNVDIEKIYRLMGLK